MLKSLLRDSTIYGTSTLLVRSVSIFLLPLYTRALAPAEYGAFDLFVLFATIVNLTIALEVGQGLARFMADATNVDEQRRFASTALFFTGGVHALFLLVCVVTKDHLAAALTGNAMLGHLVPLVALYIMSSALYSLVVNQLRWLLAPLKYAIASAANVLSNAATSAILVLGFDFGITGLLVGQLIGSLVGLSIAYWFARGTFARTFDSKALRQMIRFGLPLVPASIGVFLATASDRIIISRLLGLSSLGVYSVAFRIASVGLLLMAGVQIALTPIVYANFRQLETPMQLARAFRVFLTLALGVQLVATVFADELIVLAAGPGFRSASSIVPLLLAAAFLSRMYIFAPGLMIHKRTTAFAMVTVTAGILGAALALFLVPSLGLLGAAIATFTASACSLAAFVLLSQPLYFIPYNWKRVGAGVFAALLTFVASLGVVHSAVFGENLAYSIVSKMAIVTAGMGATGYCLLGKEELIRGWHVVRGLRSTASSLSVTSQPPGER